MAKKAKKTGFSIQGFDVAHYKQTEEYLRAIDTIYQQAVNDFALLGDRLRIDPEKPFSLADYPSANAKAQQIVNNLASRMQAVVVQGSEREWLYACKKNDEFLNHILNTSRLSKKTLQKFQDRNLSALSAFQKRKVDGLDLSKRIWRYADQFKAQMELGLDIGLGDGKSAQVLSKELRSFLVDPDKLFRRVRDKHGNLVLSKNAKAFNPGQGKYRSSYKNAMRLTRSEINMAYREADHLRWQKLDFVVGFEVKVSNKHEAFLVEWEKSNPGKVEICDQLIGRYPKTFVFKGWHPQCMCYAVPILMNPDEYNTDELNELRAALRGEDYKKFQSRNTVTDVPNGFKDWVQTNADLAQGWKSQPYFIRDNFEGGTLAGKLKVAEMPKAIKNIGNIVPSDTNVIKVVKQSDPNYANVVKAEDEIRMNKSFETAVVFDSKGNEVFRTKGSEASVAFNKNEISMLKDKILTHNHPKGWKFEEKSIRRIGNSFSTGDVLTAINHDLSEIRAVTPNYTFIMKRPAKGWGMTLEDAKRYVQMADEDVRSDMGMLIRKADELHSKKEIERAETLHYHLMWKRFCNKYNIEYTKIKTR